MRIPIAKILYFALTVIFTLMITTQIILAGMAVFIHPMHWANHTFFIHLFGFNVPLLLLIVAWLAKLPRVVYWQVFGLLLMMFSMYFSANIAGQLPWIAALHPVIGTTLLLLSFWMVIQAKFYLKKENLS
ncbi:DUF6220 domain-containing protein [Gracilibacillus sp. HCP3S3_G5_1]|uniref:DUF6220 domain-containing protein n=1 Tax=unclassified Gracilibacillus TaxID=2625209 RepID=UPI003F88FBC4